MADKSRVKLRGCLPVRLLLLLVIAQGDISQLQISIAGGFRAAVNDGPRRLQLLRVFTHQLFIDPKTYWMVVRFIQDRSLGTSLELLYLCRHIQIVGRVLGENTTSKLHCKKKKN